MYTASKWTVGSANIPAVTAVALAPRSRRDTSRQVRSFFAVFKRADKKARP